MRFILLNIKGSLWCSKRMLYLGTRRATPVEGLKPVYQISSSIGGKMEEWTWPPRPRLETRIKIWPLYLKIMLPDFLTLDPPPLKEGIYTTYDQADF